MEAGGGTAQKAPNKESEREEREGEREGRESEGERERSTHKGIRSRCVGLGCSEIGQCAAGKRRVEELALSTEETRTLRYPIPTHSEYTTHTRACTHAYTRTHTRTHTHTHTHIHTDTHTHTHTIVRAHMSMFVSTFRLTMTDHKCSQCHYSQCAHFCIHKCERV